MWVSDPLAAKLLWASGVHSETESGGNFNAGKGTTGKYGPRIIMNLSKLHLGPPPFMVHNSVTYGDDRQDPLSPRYVSQIFKLMTIPAPNNLFYVSHN